MGALAPDVAAEHSPLAIICGGGSLPIAVADAADRRGRRVVLFPVRGWANPEAVARFPHHWIATGQSGRFFRLARAEGCRDLVFIGTAVRPALRTVRLDWHTLRRLPRLWAMYRGGDDRLISGLAGVVEEEGMRLVGAHEIAPEILVPEGPLGTRRPNERDLGDVAHGLELLRAIGPFDVGQAVVVANHQVLAVEAADGTDNMLEHVAALRTKGRIATSAGTGVLVKAPKPQQDRRFDLPSIGPRTIAGVSRAGLAGIAVVGGSTIMAEPMSVAAAADQAKLFVFGVAQR